MKFKVDFIGIGVGKCGTTTIARLLDLHPQICLSQPKEVNYFNKFNATRRYLPHVNPNNKQNISPWYSNHFKHCEKASIIGEFSPIYFTDSEAPKNIYQKFPNTKLILCIRNPVDRAYSSYKMVTNYFKTETRSFKEALLAEEEYVEKGLYYKHILKYLQYFNRSQLHVICFEDLKHNPSVVLQKLYQFLDVDDNFIPEQLYTKANSAKASRFPFVTKWEIKIINMLSAKGMGWIVIGLKRMGLHLLYKKIFTKLYLSESISNEDRKWLLKQFKKDTTKLEQFLGKDLSHWKN